MGNLTALQVKNAQPGTKLLDGDGLRLDVDKQGNAAWNFRYTSPVNRRERLMGLGSIKVVSLADARELAADMRKQIRSGIDPLEAKAAAKAAIKVEERKATTFRQYASGYIDAHESAWRSPIVRRSWRSTMRDHVFPVIGDMAAGDVDVEAVLKVLRPIWDAKKETARSVRSRIENILSAARVEGLRTGENPAVWRGNLEFLLARHKRKADVKHHAALPWREMPAFWRSLAADTSDAARMLRWIITTAARYGEAARMGKGEIVSDLWTVPGARMKGGKEHCVPLTKLALAQLPFRPVSDVALTKCIRRNTDLPASTHGFRSCFRDWCGDATDYPREVAEAALAHAVGSEVEQAYRRGSALAKRRKLMDEWSRFLANTPPS
ncbi:MAG: integrase arm-type DNA-binding domain-containing protein [Xanthobacteraceae bacterium]|nr:integrase arm-type DNA-binding domain-containing protein [Xanthobacteraceae bacterium]